MIEINLHIPSEYPKDYEEFKKVYDKQINEQVKNIVYEQARIRSIKRNIGELLK